MGNPAWVVRDCRGGRIQVTDAEETTAKPRAPRAVKGGDTRTVVQRLLDIANEVGVLEPQSAPGGGIKFKYRGIDSTVAHLSPLLNKHGVIVVPHSTFENLDIRTLADGRAVTKAEVIVTYRFYGADGDYVEAQTPGQADDYADRSTAQAMSVAFRTLLLQTFHIPAFGEDPEESGEKVATTRAQPGNAKIAGAQASAAKVNASAGAAKELRERILEAGKARAIEGKELTDHAKAVTGKDTEAWWDDLSELQKILNSFQAG
jgi:hypothetical protein